MKLVSVGECEVERGIIKEGEIRKKDKLSEIIKETVKRSGPGEILDKHVVVSLPEEKSFLKVIQMPKIPEEDLKSAVIYEAENYIPLPIEDVYIDSQIVKPITGISDHFDVLIVALPKKIVDDYLDCITSAGLIPVSFEVESLSMARCLVKRGISPFPILLLDIGKTRTGFVIFSGYSIRFTASIPISSSSFNDAILKTLGFNQQEAEKMKIKYGLKNKEIFDSLTPSLTDLVEQIKNYLEYYRNHASHEHLDYSKEGVIDKIILCGGGSLLKGLKEFLSLEVKTEVVFGDPWINILEKPIKEIPFLSFNDSLRYVSALGLNLRSFIEKDN